VIVGVGVIGPVRSDDDASGSGRLKAGSPSSGIEATRDSGTFASYTDCDLEFSVAEGAITRASGFWTPA
jgi:hypothetical protein